MKLRQVDEYRWEIPREGKMRTRGLVFASAAMIAKIREDQSLQQVANVATLPGIEGPSLAMPDIHWGYGFPIGGGLPAQRPEAGHARLESGDAPGGRLGREKWLRRGSRPGPHRGPGLYR